MPLILSDLVFEEIEEATLGGVVLDPYWCRKYDHARDGGLRWGLSVEMKGKTVDNEIWKPLIDHQALYFPIRNWSEIVGQVVAWNSQPVDEVRNAAIASFYVFGSEDIPKATLRFVQRERNLFDVRWEGLCNIYWGDKYGENVPFALDARVTFKGIRVNGSKYDNDESMRARLAQYIDLQNLIQRPIERSDFQYDDGVGTAHTVFEPKSE